MVVVVVVVDRLCFRPRPAVVDLSPSTRLAGRVNEGLLRCLEGERDACLYYLLARHPGKALVGALMECGRLVGAFDTGCTMSVDC